MDDLKYMRRALQLAEKGIGSVAPNPLVGCVIVVNNQIIGEGYHQQYGEAHAEVNAIAAVSDKSLLKDATLYVTLEPCSHHGKTPPCADLIIKYNFKRIVIANKDPFEAVNGNGIEKIKAAGISVSCGILEDEAKFLNRRFFTFHLKKRPYIILKWAQSRDGFIGIDDPSLNIEDRWISGNRSKQLSHLWRSQEQAILIGRKTLEMDQPSLTSRYVNGNNPVRFILGNQELIDRDSKTFDDQSKTIVIDTNTDVFDSLFAVCRDQQLISIIIEGGAKTLQAFINKNLWDEARIFTGNLLFKDGVKSPKYEGQIQSHEKIGEDFLTTLVNPSNN